MIVIFNVSPTPSKSDKQDLSSYYVVYSLYFSQTLFTLLHSYEVARNLVHPSHLKGVLVLLRSRETKYGIRH